ncbi:MAG: YdeI/OmpD-associated family protein [Euryarchaeota archaeon]|nr:YdeI/OmpD-associated family protein [Euryarchaeota archaeon]
MEPKVDAFLKRATSWRDEMARLRSIALDSGLSEELKWGKPCYTVEEGNVAIIQPFKEHCAFLFFKGALLTDPDSLLERPGPNSHAARRMMFSSLEEVVEGEPRLRAFIAQAIEVEKAGMTVEGTKRSEPVPDELVEMFRHVSGLKKAFEKLTPGRQRAYILHFSSAKQAKTRTARIEKNVPRILEGKGMND